ncbi:hypothetical protein [Chondromyces crocatus]|uniref:Uncharacterized protein n=1 Tax=Chondromyces crocatus TaxID=52 RepID=A0A0K1ERZ5_CHOCO|nr:hypothetical protein [Chondromyces crocatus]AKT43432.1 uncharacterized protein CMC5_076640 [Chondromyces crocatus]
MIHNVDDRLREEARRFRLVFACPDCASFDPGAPDLGDPPRCSLGFPVEPHLSQDLTAREQVIFCKAFELG